MLIDTHCHLQQALDRGDIAATLNRMEEAGVGRCITVGTSRKDWESYFRLASRESGRVDWTAGIHPCDIEEDWSDQLRTVSTYFATEPEPVALGEIGLDYFHLPKYPDEAAEVRQLQQRVFTEQLHLAYQLNCPIVIHSRDAVEDCIRLIDQSGVDWQRVVFHCFTDGPDKLKPVLERGGRASFTGILTYRSAGPVRLAALEQGLERLMLETDSPYLTPEPLRGKPNEPAHAALVADFAAGLFECSRVEIEEITTRNAIAFFTLDPA